MNVLSDFKIRIKELKNNNTDELQTELAQKNELIAQFKAEISTLKNKVLQSQKE